MIDFKTVIAQNNKPGPDLAKRSPPLYFSATSAIRFATTIYSLLFLGLKI
jgi:hypothetical protein